MLDNNKGLVWMTIILLIFAIIALIVVTFVIINMNQDASYESSILECSFIFSNIKGKPDYFGEKQDLPTLKLENIISKTCPSKDYKIDNNDVENSVKLVQDCWAKVAKGAEIMGKNTNDLGICLYCGRVIVDENIENFDQKFIEKINKNEYSSLFDYAQINNTNNITLKNQELLPNRIDSTESLGVFYYVYKPKVECVGEWNFDLGGCAEKIQISFSKMVGDWGGLFTRASYYGSSSHANSYGGIVLGVIDEDTDNKFQQNSISVGDESVENKFNCDLIIVPERNY